MFRWIIGASLKFRFLVIALAVAMVVVGSNAVSDQRHDPQGFGP